MQEKIEEVFFTISPDGKKIFDVSCNSKKVWGEKCKILKQNPNYWLYLVHPEDKEKVSLAWSDLLEKGKTFQKKYRIIRSDRSRAWVYTRSFSLKKGGKLEGYAIISTEIEVKKVIKINEEKIDNKRKKKTDFWLFKILLQQSKKNLKLINNILEYIVLAENREDLIESTLLNLSSYFNGLSVAYLNINNKNEITIVKAITPVRETTIAGEKLDFQLVPKYWEACQTSSFVAVADLTKDDRLSPLKEKMLAMGMRGILNLPLKHSGVLLGLLKVFSPKPHHWQEREINTFIDAANYLSLGIRNLEIDRALKTSEKRWQLALQATGDQIWDWDIKSDRVLFYQIKESKIRQINNNMEQWRERIHPEDLAKVLAALKQHLTRKTPFALEYRVSNQYGLYKMILSRGQAEWDESGLAVRMVGIESNLSDCQQTDRDLQQNEPRYLPIVENMTEGVAIFNEKREFLFANQQLANILGCTVKELLYSDSYDFVYEEDKPKMLKRSEDRLKGIKERYDSRLRRKDGSGFWAAISANPILDEGGKYCGTLVTVRDISDRKLAEQQIAKTEIFLKTLIDRLPLCLFVKDSAGRYVKINRSCEQFFGYKEREVIGKTDYDFFPKEQADLLVQKDRRVFISRTEVEIPIETLDSPLLGRRLFRTIKLPLYDSEGQPEYLMGLAEDITERQQIQSALEESEKKYRQIIETMSEGVWVLDVEGSTTFVNQQMAEMLGYSISSMSDRHLLEFMDEAAKVDAREKLERCRQGIPEKHDFRFRRKDGSDLWAIVSSNPIFDENGEYKGLLGIITDISDRKQSQARLSLALEAGKIVCWEANLLTNRVSGFGWISEEWVNDSWELSTKELFAKVFTREERKFAKKIIARAIKNQSEFILEHRYPLSLEKWFMMKGKVIADPSGRVTSIVGISVDISERKRAEIKIQQTDEFLQTLINSLPVALFVQDATPETFGQLVLLNQNCERLFGMNTEQAIHKTCQELFPKEQAECLTGKDREAFVNNTKVDIAPVAIDTKNLGQRILRATKVPLYDLDDRPQYLLCIAEDITERHLAQVALQASEARLAGILDNAEDGIISIDSNRRITLFNKGAEKIFNYTTAEILGQPLELLMPDRFYPAHNRYITDFERSREVARRMGQRDAVFARRKDGSEFPAEVSISQLKLAGATIFTAIIRDITARKLAETNLRENKQFLESIFESAAEVIWVVERTEDGDFCILTINQSIEKFTGIPPREWIGKGINETYQDPQIAAKFRSNYEICLQKETSVTFEHCCTLCKQERYFLITMSPLQTSTRSTPDLVRILAVAVDISDRKKAEKTLLELEKQREVSQMQLRFFSMASHEFRTPLSTILVIVQSLISYLDRLPQEKILNKLYQLEKVAKRMTDIIDNILKINRAETENLQIETQLLNPEEICHSIVNEMRINAGKDRQITFASQGKNKRSPINPKLFNYILTNLLANAIKYSPRSSKIHVILKSQPAKLILIVKDHGVGIPKSELPQLFEAFHRGKNIENTPGSGLGLTLVKKCVDLHQGTIEVDSEPGKGTSFIVTIPV